MREFITSLVLAAALVLGLTYSGSAPQGHASPVTPQASAPQHIYQINLTKDESYQEGAAKNVRKHTPGKILDYHVARHYFANLSRPALFRREFAYGWQAMGGKIINLNQAERTAIHSVPHPAAFGATPLVVPRCTGVNQGPVLLTGQITFNLRIKTNSCVSHALEVVTQYCGIATGAMAFLLGPDVSASAALGSLALSCGEQWAWINIAISDSSVKAMIIRLPLPGDQIARITRMPALYLPQ